MKRFTADKRSPRGGNAYVTEARFEGLIELQLVRKPPKVSRGYGGVARAARAARAPGEAYRCRGAASLVVQVSQILAFAPMDV